MIDRTPTGDLDAAVPGTPLKPLGRLHNYRIVEGDPDVRGWDVVGANGDKVGEVADLLVDTSAGKVRYLDVAVLLGRLAENTTDTGTPAPLGTPTAAVPAHAAMGGLAPLITETVVRSTLSDAENALTQEHHHGPGSRHVLIPVGYARLDSNLDRVHLEALSAARLAELPAYDFGDLDREAEARVRQGFDRDYAHSPEGDFYAHPLYDEDRFYGSRRHTDRSQALAESARAAGLEPGDAAPAGEQDRTITGELDRAVGAPDHSRLRDEAEAPEEAALPIRGR